MNYQLKILRGTGTGESFWQTFFTPCGEKDSVACALEELNSRPLLQDTQGAAAEPIGWDCACLEKKCGACAMVISGKPRLACAAALGRSADREGVVTLRPLSKFPRRKDLQVDRNALFRTMGEMQLWMEGKSGTAEDGAAPALQYAAARCLMCGLCLEVCPNFTPGSSFAGAAAVPAAFGALQTEGDGEHEAELRRQYRRRFYGVCAKSLSCEAICPAEVPVEQLLVKTNAAAVWRRRKKK